jgi:hypothetical protein
MRSKSLKTSSVLSLILSSHLAVFRELEDTGSPRVLLQQIPSTAIAAPLVEHHDQALTTTSEPRRCKDEHQFFHVERSLQAVFSMPTLA